MQTFKQITQNKDFQTLSGIHANQGLSRTKPTISSISIPTEKTRKQVDCLFLKFSAFYGQVWRSQFKNEEYLAFVKNEWCEGLKAIEERHIQAAILNCRDSKEYPPTLVQFIKLCKVAKNREWIPKSQGTTKKSNLVTVQRHLTQIKKILNMTVNEGI